MRVDLRALALTFALLAGVTWVSGSEPLVHPAHAQNDLRIAAIVNDDVISAYDLDQRLKLALSSTGVPDTPDNRTKLRDQVLRALIVERLEMQEAKRMNIVVSDEDIAHAFGILAQQNRISPDKFEDFLRQEGVDINALTAQLRGEIAWSHVVRQKFLPQIDVTDQQVDAALARIKANRDELESQLSLIFLPYDTPDQAEKIRQQAVQLTEQIRGGASFAGAARQFSQGPAAAAGGAVGWVEPGRLPEEVDKVIATLALNTPSEPVRSLTGFYIVEVHGRRRIGSAPPTPEQPVRAAPKQQQRQQSQQQTVSVKVAPGATVHLMQALFPLPPKAAPAVEKNVMAQAQRISDTARSCKDMARLTAALNSRDSGDIGTLKISNLPKVLQQVVASLPIGMPSKTIRSNNGVHVLMVCARTGVTEVKQEAPAVEPVAAPVEPAQPAPAATSQEIPLPSRDQVRHRLTEQRLELQSRGFLRDLRRDAIVEFR